MNNEEAALVVLREMRPLVCRLSDLEAQLRELGYDTPARRMDLWEKLIDGKQPSNTTDTRAGRPS